MGGTYDVKETKEGILALVVLGKFVADRLRDGAGLDDVSALVMKLVSDPAFKVKVEAGINGADKIPTELSELDMADILELAKVLPQILEILV